MHVASPAGFSCFVQVYLVQPVYLYKRVVCFCNIKMLVLFFWRLKLELAEFLQSVTPNDKDYVLQEIANLCWNCPGVGQRASPMSAVLPGNATAQCQLYCQVMLQLNVSCTAR